MAKASMFAFPSIHLNGTSQGQLLAQYMRAHSAVLKAIEAVQQNGPHPRDYYVQGNDAWRQAEREHVERMQKLKNVEQEIYAIMLHIDRGGKNEEDPR